MMLTTTHKKSKTFALGLLDVQRVEDFAKQEGLSRSEALRRIIFLHSEKAGNQPAKDPLRAVGEVPCSGGSPNSYKGGSCE